MNLRLKGTTAIGLAACMLGGPVFADMDAAKAFLDTEIGDLSSLSRAEQEAELQFSLAHCNFGLRGQESKGDEDFLHEYASKLNRTIYVTHFNALGYEKLAKVVYTKVLEEDTLFFELKEK